MHKMKSKKTYIAFHIRVINFRSLRFGMKISIDKKDIDIVFKLFTHHFQYRSFAWSTNSSYYTRTTFFWFHKTRKNFSQFATKKVHYFNPLTNLIWASSCKKVCSILRKEIGSIIIFTYYELKNVTTSHNEDKCGSSPDMYHFCLNKHSW